MNRYKANKCNAVSQQPALHNALAKYGWDNVTVEWIAGGPENAPIPEEWLDELEEMFIARFNTVFGFSSAADGGAFFFSGGPAIG